VGAAFRRPEWPTFRSAGELSVFHSSMPLLKSAITRSLDGVLSVALAPACAACARVLDAPSGGPVCAACWSGIGTVLPPLCATCGDPLPSWRVLTTAEGVCARCRRAPPAFDCARSAGDYEGSLREILHAFKYDGRRSLAHPLAAMMRETGAALLAGADCVVPVPLHPWRRLMRGFNQAQELATHLDTPVVRALWRTRATLPQSGLRPAQRRRNVRAAFRLSPLVRRARLQDACVVLVDDVRTTGATLDACARVLKDAGVREVSALTVARAVAR
jgi:ComF family protein